MADNVAGINKSSGGRVTEAVTATATGDIIAFDGTDLQRLAVGTDGQVLTADSGEATGIKWATSGGGATTLLTSTATEADINTALADAANACVFLAPGTYSFTSTQISIPAGKCLKGAAMQAVEDTVQTGQVRLEWSGNPSGGAIAINEGGSLQGVHVIKTGAAGTVNGIVRGPGGTVNAFLEVIDCHANNWSNGIVLDGSSASTATDGIRVVGCVAENNTSFGFDYQGGGNAAGEHCKVIFDSCTARGNGSHGFVFTVDASIDVSVAGTLRNCSAFGNGGSGFFIGGVGGAGFSGSQGSLHVAFNTAQDNTSHGFNVTGLSGGTMVGNRSITNGGWGYNLALTHGSTTNDHIGVFMLNEARGNTSGNFDYQTSDTLVGRETNFSEEQAPGTVFLDLGSGLVTVTLLNDLLADGVANVSPSPHTILLGDNGTVALGTTQLVVTDGKRLIGGYNAFDFNGATLGRSRFTYTGTGAAIRVDEGGEIRGVQVAQAGTAGTGTGISGNGTILIHSCHAEDFSVGIDTGANAGGGTKVYACTTVDCTTGFIQNGVPTFHVVMEDCWAKGGTTGFDLEGPTGNGQATYRNLKATDCSGDGFNQRNQWGATTASLNGMVQLVGCVAEGCNIGFDLDNFNNRKTRVVDCHAFNCTNEGFACGLGVIADGGQATRPYIGSCSAANCGTPFSVDGGWSKGPLWQADPNGGGSTTGVAADQTERMLGWLSQLNIRAISTTTIYQALAFERVIVTKVVIRTHAFNGPMTTDADVRLNGPGTGDLIGTKTLTGLKDNADRFVTIRPADDTVLPVPHDGDANTGAIDFEIVVAETGGTAHTVDVELWGYIAIDP